MENEKQCAFPADSKTQTDGGLTKLEYASIQAMKGILATQPGDNFTPTQIRHIVTDSIACARTLLILLSETPKE